MWDLPGPEIQQESRILAGRFLSTGSPGKSSPFLLWPSVPVCWLAFQATSALKRKDPDAGKDWGQEEKGMTEDEMVGWHHPTQWTWVWVNSGSWWWTGRPSVLRFMGSQRVRHNWATELNCPWKKEHQEQPQAYVLIVYDLKERETPFPSLHKLSLIKVSDRDAESSASEHQCQIEPQRQSFGWSRKEETYRLPGEVRTQ